MLSTDSSAPVLAAKQSPIRESVRTRAMKVRPDTDSPGGSRRGPPVGENASPPGKPGKAGCRWGFRREKRCFPTGVFLVLSWFLPNAGGSDFTDQTKAAGVEFFHVSGGEVKNHIIETMGGGAAFFDYDNDGALDLYAVNGSTVDTYLQKSGPGNVLYRNKGTGSFADVTGSTGTGDRGWGMGCTVGDIDGDGYGDLYVTNYGPNILYHNLASGSFEDVTARAGVAGNDYSASAAFFDCDNDGDLDLYATTYLVYDPGKPPGRTCTYGGFEIYCGPQGLPRGGDVLYRNEGGNRFTDVTRASGIAWANRYYGLGVLPADLDRDGDTDLFVANDKTPNLVFRNDGGGTFSETGLKAGVAYNAQGKEEAGMGIGAGDYDGDGDTDLYVTHFFRESNTLYRNDGSGRFRDVTRLAGLERPTLEMLGWGTAFFDWDNDGDLDLFVANGHVYPQIDLESMGTSYRQRNQLFRNEGEGRLEEVPAAECGMEIEKVSRGAAFADYDNDGDIDIFVVNLDDTATLLRNETSAGNWLTVQLFGSGENRHAVGARIRLVAAGGEQVRTVSGAGSYLSFSDSRAHFGLGPGSSADLVEIAWPGGGVRTVESVPANRLLVVRQGGPHTVLTPGSNPYE